MYDLIIKDGLITDGTGRDAYLADIAVKDGKIAAIGRLQEVADRIIDATGKYVTPGFIDPHSHADLSLLVWPKNEAYTLQGVTTQICGNCGLAPAPINDELWEFFCWEYKSVNRACKSVFDMYTWQSDADATRKALKEDYDLNVDWHTLGEFMDIAEKHGFSCNYYPISGHNHIRNAVMGKAYRPATDEEIEKMKEILRDDLEHGSQGLSTGLDYIPGRFAETKEIEALLNIVAEYDGVYNTHVRGFDPKHPEKLDRIYGVREAVELCRRTGVKTDLSHMSALYSFSPSGSEKLERAVAEISRAEMEKGWKEGLNIMYDVIANPSMGGSTIPYLANLVRPWLLMCGSMDHFLEMLEFPDFVQMMADQTAAGKSPLLLEMDELDIKITRCLQSKYEDKLLADIVEENGFASRLDAVLTILKANPNTEVTPQIAGGDTAVSILLDSPRAMPCADGFAFDLDSEMDYPAPLNRKPHPNNYCYAIRYLLHYGPQRFEDKVKQMTSVPAQWFGIEGRGVLAEGNWADIVVLDRERLCANEGNGSPEGVDYVIINGQIAADHRKHTGVLAGKVLRKARH